MAKPRKTKAKKDTKKIEKEEELQEEEEEEVQDYGKWNVIDIFRLRLKIKLPKIFKSEAYQGSNISPAIKQSFKVCNDFAQKQEDFKFPKGPKSRLIKSNGIPETSSSNPNHNNVISVLDEVIDECYNEIESLLDKELKGLGEKKQQINTVFKQEKTSSEEKSTQEEKLIEEEKLEERFIEEEPKTPIEYETSCATDVALIVVKEEEDSSKKRKNSKLISEYTKSIPIAERKRRHVDSPKTPDYYKKKNLIRSMGEEIAKKHHEEELTPIEEFESEIVVSDNDDSIIIPNEDDLAVLTDKLCDAIDLDVQKEDSEMKNTRLIVDELELTYQSFSKYLETKLEKLQNERELKLKELELKIIALQSDKNEKLDPIKSLLEDFNAAITNNTKLILEKKQQKREKSRGRLEVMKGANNK